MKINWADEIKKDLKAYCLKYGVGKLIYRKWFKEMKPVEVKEAE